MSVLKEFKTFISRGNVVDLATGVIVGTAFTAIVNSLVNDIIMPPLGWILGGLDFSSYYINLSGQAYASLAEAQKAGAATINYGLFINALIKFLIVAFAVFMMVKQINRFHKREDAKPASPSAEVVLLTEIRDVLKEKS